MIIQDLTISVAIPVNSSELEIDQYKSIIISAITSDAIKKSIENFHIKFSIFPASEVLEDDRKIIKAQAWKNNEAV